MKNAIQRTVFLALLTMTLAACATADHHNTKMTCDHIANTITHLDDTIARGASDLHNNKKTLRERLSHPDTFQSGAITAPPLSPQHIHIAQREKSRLTAMSNNKGCMTHEKL